MWFFLIKTVKLLNFDKDSLAVLFIKTIFQKVKKIYNFLIFLLIDSFLKIIEKIMKFIINSNNKTLKTKKIIYFISRHFFKKSIVKYF